jgi:5'-nucleotidase
MNSPDVTARRAVILLLVACLTTICAQAQKPRTVRVTLLQLNDVYQISPVDRGKNAGLARVATIRKKILTESPNTLFMLGGDTISPSVASTVFRGAQMIAAWNSVGLDYAVLGNHEFDFGEETLLARMKESRFVWLGSNVIDRRTGKPFNNIPQYVIRNIGGIRIGIIGLLTTDTETSSNPGKNIRFVDPVLVTKRLVPIIKRRGATVIVALTHLSMTEDKRVAGTGLVDVILGGHEHELLQSHSGRAPIFKWGSDARVLGRIDLNINARRKKLESIDWAGIPVTDAVEEEPVTAAIVARYEKELSAELDKPLGSTSVELDALQINNRNQETNLGNLVTDAFRQATTAEICILNGGSIRSNTKYPAGQISKRDILSILPFENQIVKVEVSGALIKAALENGVSQLPDEKESGRFPQVSGLHFEFDTRKSVGSRVVKIMIGGQPLDEKKNYTLTSSSYLINGGDGYTMFKNARYLINAESAQIDAVILANYVGTSGVIAPKVEGRIKRLD